MRFQLFLILCCFMVPARAQAELLERKIDVQFAQIPLRDALNEVAQKGNFEWSYNSSIINGQQRVSLRADHWTVREILYHLLGDGYTFKSNGNYLIIKKVKKSPDQIYGYVKNPKTGERVAGATVFDKTTLRATTTDSNGFYSLKVKQSTQLVVTKLDWRDTLLQVNSQSGHFVEIPLEVLPPDTLHWPGPDFEDAFFDEINDMNAELVRLFNATRNKWHERNLRDSIYRDWQVSLLPNIGTNHTLSGQVINKYSFNILAGYSKAVRRLEVGGLGNFTQKSVHGVQVGGLFNHNRGDTKGIQIGGIYNLTADSLSGIQVAGLNNVARFAQAGTQVGGVGNVIGAGQAALQVGGIFNHTMGDTRGVQIAGVYNLTWDTLAGVQTGGVFNWANTTQSGLQISGLLNIASQGTASLQIGGAFNAADTVKGVQISGLINHARRVKGVQIGVFNSANDCDCLQIGLLNRIGGRWLPVVNWKASAGKRKKHQPG